MAGTAIGTVTQVNGPLLLKRANGSIKALALNSFVEQGDTLVTEKNTYAQLKFADDSEVTLKPDTQLKIEVLVFNAATVTNMDTIFSISKGAVQIKTGATARATPESIRLVMPSLLDPVASVTLDRKAGTTFVAQYVEASAENRLARFDSKRLAARYPALRLAAVEPAYRSDAPAIALPKNWDAPQLLAQVTAPSSGPGLAPGLYVHVIDGLIQLSNSGGSQNFSAGQFGFTPNLTQPPVILPTNPGIQFSPPPSFSTLMANPTSSSASGKSATVDCMVR
ncbi:MAG: iron dicitrate transport regulator FecR [Rhodoferax sp.]